MEDNILEEEKSTLEENSLADDEILQDPLPGLELIGGN